MLVALYLDELGIYRHGSVDGQELLGSFLEEDIQSSIDSCDIVLQLLLDVEQGVREPFELTGNAHAVLMQPGKVSIEHLWLYPPVPPLELTAEQFRQALLEWRNFIATTPRSDISI